MPARVGWRAKTTHGVTKRIGSKNSLAKTTGPLLKDIQEVQTAMLSNIANMSHGQVMPLDFRRLCNLQIRGEGLIRRNSPRWHCYIVSDLSNMHINII
jgi:hypothetical protein